MTVRPGPSWWAAVGGLAWGACWLPWLPAWLTPAAFALLLIALGRVEHGRQAAWIGVVFAVATYGVGGHFLWVLTRFSPFGAAFFFALIVYQIPFAVAATWGAFRIERATGVPRTTAFGALYVGLEGFRTVTDLSFPADLVANAFGDLPSWLAWTPWTGPHGVAVWAMAVAILLERVFAARGGSIRLPVWTATVAAALWVAPWVTSPWLAPVPSVEPALRVGIVQPKVGVREKFDRTRRPEIWNRLTALSEEVAFGVDLLVWPESARPGAIRWDDRGPFRDPTVEHLARRFGVPILYGSEIARFRDDELVALYNGAAIAYPDDRPGAWYGKQRLLPFAEGVPFAGLFGYDPIASARDRGSGVLTMLGKFSRGPRPTLFEVAGARIGVLICYEGMYPAISARYRRDGADALAILTNDLWWGRTAFPRWHANQAASVARSMRVPVLRAANAGVSGAHAPDGSLVASTELLAATSRIVDVPRASGPAPRAARVGPAVPWVVIVALAGLAIRTRFLRPRSES